MVFAEGTGVFLVNLVMVHRNIFKKVTKLCTVGHSTEPKIWIKDEGFHPNSL